jgi:hypothetical protein
VELLLMALDKDQKAERLPAGEAEAVLPSEVALSVVAEAALPEVVPL